MLIAWSQLSARTISYAKLSPLFVTILEQLKIHNMTLRRSSK
jgi:hypothetical protein